MFGRDFAPAPDSLIAVNILLVTPAPLRITNGNRVTALRWAAMLKELGHRVKVAQRYEDRRFDALVAVGRAG